MHHIGLLCLYEGVWLASGYLVRRGACQQQLLHSLCVPSCSRVVQRCAAYFCLLTACCMCGNMYVSFYGFARPLKGACDRHYVHLALLIHMCVYVCVYVCIYIYIYIYIYTHTHTCTHTYTQRDGAKKRDRNEGTVDYVRLNVLPLEQLRESNGVAGLGEIEELVRIVRGGALCSLLCCAVNGECHT